MSRIKYWSLPPSKFRSHRQTLFSAGNMRFTSVFLTLVAAALAAPVSSPTVDEVVKVVSDENDLV